MTHDYEQVWARLPAKVDDHYGVAIVEALWRIGKPLAAIDLVDVFDGYMSMWDAATHLQALERARVVELVPRAEIPQAGHARFDIPYRLVGRGASEDA